MDRDIPTVAALNGVPLINYKSEAIGAKGKVATFS